MKSKLLLIFMSLLQTGQIALASNSHDNQLLASQQYSFCTKAQNETRIGFIGHNWAFVFILTNKDFESANGIIQQKVVRLYRGPKISRYIGKSAGPRRPAVPKNKLYSLVKLTDLTIRFKSLKQGNLYSVDRFIVDEQAFVVKIPFPIFCSGPLP